MLGGLIAGPLGAVVGGLSGAKDMVEKAQMPDLLLTISYEDQRTGRAVVLSCEYKTKASVENFFKKYYPRKFRVTM